jgi:ABC-type cobalamin/Fe3+-siderophores transport system ATPase subunit
MPRLIGRESELTALRAAYATLTSTQRAHTLVITGAAGSGKTTLTYALEEMVTPAALVVRATAQPFDRVLPFALLERLGSDLHERLDRATLDRAAVVIVRDAQFADDESRASLAAYRRALANRPLLLVLTRSDDDDRSLPIDIDMEISLGELDSRSAHELAREHYPQASQSVLDAIVANARGIPYELATIAAAAARRGAANPAAVDFSARAAIAKELAAMPAQQRSALQLLSLLAEPVEPAIIEVEAPDVTLQMDHVLTAAAISETIAMKIPLRRRIIGALDRRGVRTLRERLVFAEQAVSSGDRALAQRALLDLTSAAAAEHNGRAVTWAAERHIEIGEPPDDRLIDFYNNFFAALMETRAFARAESVAAHALSEAQHRGLRGLGSLAAHLVQAQWTGERSEAAKASYERYARAFDDPKDLELLREAAPWLNAV